VTLGVKLVKTILLGFAEEGAIVYDNDVLLAKGPNSYLSGWQAENSSTDPKKTTNIFNLFFMSEYFKLLDKNYQPAFCFNTPDDRVIWSLGICWNPRVAVIFACNFEAEGGLAVPSYKIETVVLAAIVEAATLIP